MNEIALWRQAIVISHCSFDLSNRPPPSTDRLDHDYTVHLHTHLKTWAEMAPYGRTGWS